jgi:putative hydrolase of the HAD superfamily
VRAILFDLDDTLFERAPAFARWARQFAEQRGLTAPDAVSTIVALDARGRPRREAVASAIVAHFGLDEDAAALALRMPGELAACAEPEPGVAETIATLGTRYRLGVVTNGPGPSQRAKLARIGLTAAFSTIAISAEVGVWKPDRAIFDLALAAVGCTPEETVMVGDSLESDLAPARALGMPTAWIDRLNERAGGDPATYVARSLPLLAEQLP